MAKSRNRRVDDEEEISDDEDEDFAADEEEGDEEDESSSPKNDRKRKKASFLDVAASEDDEVKHMTSDLCSVHSKSPAIYVRCCTFSEASEQHPTALRLFLANVLSSSGC